MSAPKKGRYQTTINAPAATVWDTMLSAASYRIWTSAFGEGSYFEGDWSQGSRMRFLTPDGDGMLAEIAQCRKHEFLSIRHIGFVYKGKEDTQSDAVKSWAPAYENYALEALPDGGTQLRVEQDLTDEYEAFMNETWPKALALLKQLCENES